MSEQDYRVRECVHRARGAAGDYYNGANYVRHLQRLRSAAAVSFAGKVTAFFWADAAHVLVWLCRDCASEIGIREN
jgi:uncharacterized protein YfaT (DUF1175 family)